MYYIVALGNPGEQYTKTRHNVGFATLDFLVENFRLPAPVKKAEYAGLFGEATFGGEDIVYLYPETFMNNSGAAVKKLVSKDELSKLVVLYDDIALPLGDVRVSFDRGDGGHNGLKSIIASVGSKEFVRVRIGIAPTSFWTGKPKNLTGEVLPKFVLGLFTKSEIKKLVEEVFPKVGEVVKTIIGAGYVKAMNTFN